jgi:hypothetical protein
MKLETEEQQLEAVKIDPGVIRCIKNPSEMVQLEAVRQDWWAIRHIENPTLEVQTEAVMQDEVAFVDIHVDNHVRIFKALLSKGHEFNIGFDTTVIEAYQKAKLELQVESSLEKDFS